MSRLPVKCLITAICMAALASCALPATGQDNPILRERLGQKMIEELSKHDSQEKAWYSEKKVDRQKWTEGKILGKPVRLASWTEESKLWIWLEGPTRSLSLDLRQLAIRDGRLEFSLSAKANARFKSTGRIPKLAQATVGGRMIVQLEITGSAAIGSGHLEQSRITLLKGEIHELQFNNDLAHPFENLIKGSLNDYVEDKNQKLRHSLEKAIDRVHF
ncbi:MAG TPA: hypothetical protein VHV08_05040 [Pirellulales bacterium]|jgi:hypothetical protein|nr:hypothetical protein [Pirellulales bacterium]